MASGCQRPPRVLTASGLRGLPAGEGRWPPRGRPPRRTAASGVEIPEPGLAVEKKGLHGLPSVGRSSNGSCPSASGHGRRHGMRATGGGPMVQPLPLASLRSPGSRAVGPQPWTCVPPRKLSSAALTPFSLISTSHALPAPVPAPAACAGPPCPAGTRTTDQPPLGDTVLARGRM